MSPMKSIGFGIGLGGLFAACLSVVIELWEWLENPGGIFHDANGTNWSFVFDTLVSWLLPTFYPAAIIAALCHLLVGWVRRRS